ncbi:MAG: AMP-dependent synthetase/ligase [Hyphomicrobiaceae bacterium]
MSAGVSKRMGGSEGLGLEHMEKARPNTFPKLLLQHAAERGQKPALREKNRGIWRTTTWGDLASEVTAIAGGLSDRGLKRGDHVAVLGDNRPQLYAAICAAQWLGAIAVPLFQDATAKELVEPINRAGVTHIFAENQEQVDKLLGILSACPTIACIVYDDDRGMRHYEQPQLISYDTLAEQGRELSSDNREALQEELTQGSGSDAAFLYFTPGSTGVGKGVILTHGALIDRARVAAAAEKLTDSDVAIAYLSPGWIGEGLFSYVQALVVGYCVCCPESSDTMLADMREIGPTYFLATPRVLEVLHKRISLQAEDTSGLSGVLYRRCMNLADRIGARILSREPVPVAGLISYSIANFLIYAPLRDALGMSNIRVAFTTGDVVDPDVLMFFRSLGVNLKQLYGSTETGFLISMQRNGEVRGDTVGRPTEGVELSFSPQSEILVRSPGLFRAYHDDLHNTNSSVDAEGWFRTGDAGYLDDDGQLRIIDRLANVGVLKDGAKLAPARIENKLKFFPYIMETVVVGDGREMVCALVDIDMSAVSAWADRQAMSYTGRADLVSREETYGLVAECIAKVNAELAKDPERAHSQIHRFAILHKELDADDGLLTRTGKLRRKPITERFKPIIDAMYEGQSEVQFDFGADDELEGLSTGLKIRDADVTSAAHGISGRVG